jgi:hypothetical protein
MEFLFYTLLTEKSLYTLSHFSCLFLNLSLLEDRFVEMQNITHLRLKITRAINLQQRTGIQDIWGGAAALGRL